MGETITHETLDAITHGPVHATASGINNILTNGGNYDSLLSDVLNETGTWQTIQSSDMLTAVLESAKSLKLRENGI